MKKTLNRQKYSLTLPKFGARLRASKTPIGVGGYQL